MSIAICHLPRRSRLVAFTSVALDFNPDLGSKLPPVWAIRYLQIAIQQLTSRIGVKRGELWPPLDYPERALLSHSPGRLRLFVAGVRHLEALAIGEPSALSVPWTPRIIIATKESSFVNYECLFTNSISVVDLKRTIPG